MYKCNAKNILFTPRCHHPRHAIVLYGDVPPLLVRDRNTRANCVTYIVSRSPTQNYMTVIIYCICAFKAPKTPPLLPLRSRFQNIILLCLIRFEILCVILSVKEGFKTVGGGATAVHIIFYLHGGGTKSYGLIICFAGIICF